MEWVNLSELYTAFGLAIASGLLLGALVAIFNSWRA